MTRGLLQEVQPQATPALRSGSWNHVGPGETPAPASCSNGHGYSWGYLIEICLCLRNVTLLLLWAYNKLIPAFDCLLGGKKSEKMPNFSLPQKSCTKFLQEEGAQ